MPTLCPQCGQPHDSVEGLCLGCLAGEFLAPEPLTTEGRWLGKYELFEELGRGGMGAVYRARQPGLNRQVAVKVLLGGEFTRPEFLARFQQEAEVAAKLHHPNLVTIHEVGQDEDVAFYSMELVEGCSLQEGWPTKIKAGDFRSLAAFLAKVAAAVTYAHEQGVLHRDLKPANIMVDASGEPKIADFGLARLLEGTSDFTRTNQVLGSPPYMSPEQTKLGESKVGSPADVYSLGAVLYFLLANRPPFQGNSVAQILAQVERDVPVSPHRLNPAVPRDLETICLKCLEKEPKRRYASAQDLADDLLRFSRKEPVRARPLGAFGRFSRWCRRKPAIASLLAALLFGAAGAIWRIELARRAERVSADLALNEAHKAREAAALAKKNEILASGHARQAEASGKLAEENARKALEAAKLAEDNAKRLEASNRSMTALLDETQVQRAEDFFAAKDTTSALRVLLDSLKRNPDQSAASARLVAALGENPWALPDGDSVPYLDCLRFMHPLEGNQRVLTIGRDFGRSGVYDVATLKQLYPLKGAPRKAFAYVVNPAGTRVAITSDADYKARVWDPRSGERVGQDMPCGPRDWSLAMSPDGARLAVVSRIEFRPLLYRVEDGQVLPWESADWAEPVALAWSNDGRWLAVMDRLKGVGLWDVAGETPRLTTTLAHAGFALRFTPRGELITASHDYPMKSWSVPEGKLLGQAGEAPGWTQDMRLSPKGDQMAACTNDGKMRIYHVPSLEAASPMFAHGVRVDNMEFSPDGSRLASSGGENSTRIWDARTGEPVCQPLSLPRIITQEQPYSVAWRKDGQSFLMGGAIPRLCPWRLSPSVAVPRHFPEGVGKFCCPWGQSTVYASLGVGWIVALDARTLETRWRVWVAKKYVTSMTVDPTGKSLAWGSEAGKEGASFGVLETATGKALGESKAMAHSVTSLSWHPEAAVLVAGSNEGELQAWSWPERLLWKKEADGNSAFELCPAPDRASLAVASESGRCLILAYETGRESASFPYSQPGQITHGLGCQFTPDGKTLVLYGSSGPRSHQWTGARNGKQVLYSGSIAHLSPRGDRAYLGGAIHWLPLGSRPSVPLPAASLYAWSPDSERIALRLNELEARVFDANTGHPVTGPMRHTSLVHWLSFADETTLISSCPDGLYRWPIPKPVKAPLSPEILDLAEILAGRVSKVPTPEALRRIEELYGDLGSNRPRPNPPGQAQ